jgi:hypothetical protein
MKCTIILQVGDEINYSQERLRISFVRRGSLLTESESANSIDLYSILLMTTLATGLSLVQEGELSGQETVTFTLSTNSNWQNWHRHLFTSDGILTKLQDKDFVIHNKQQGTLSFRRDDVLLHIGCLGKASIDTDIELDFISAMRAIDTATTLGISRDKDDNFEKSILSQNTTAYSLVRLMDNGYGDRNT